MPKKNDTDLIVSTRFNDDEYLMLRDLKVLSGIDSNATAIKLAIRMARKEILRLTDGKFKLKFERIAAEDIRKLTYHLPKNRENVLQQIAE